MFKLDKKIISKLENSGKKKAEKLATEAKNKIMDRYISLIDWYYADYNPKLDKYGVPYYIRTFNLYNSFTPYKRKPSGSGTTYYGGIKIESGRMKNYNSIKGDTFSAEDLLKKFIYNSSGTWHGGDWHGGYGETANFNIYNEIQKYKKQLIDEYRRDCSVK